MIIIVEGLDKCGKSTLVEYLVKNLPDTLLIKNGFKPRDNNELERRKIVKIYKDMLWGCDYFKDNNIILDRYFISELVYSKKRGYNGFANPGMREFINEIEDRNDVILIHCNVPKEDIKTKFIEDKEDYIKVSEIESLEKKYREVVGYLKLETLPYNYTITDPADVVKKLKYIIKEKSKSE